MPFNIEDPQQVALQAKDKAQVDKDIASAKTLTPKIDDEVNVVVGGRGPAFGSIRKARVIAVSVPEGGVPVIDVEIPSVKDGDKSRVQKGNPYVSPERLTLKHRPNTWHWPDGAKPKK